MEKTPPVAELNRKFGIPGFAEVVTGNGGLPRVHISSAVANGDIYLHGAHVTAWSPPGADEVLFVSSASKWEEGKAIRGGVPICFPWFGDKADDPTAPAHGFLRTTTWSLDSITVQASVVTVTMSIGSDEATQRWWPADFRATYRATFGTELKLELQVRNAGGAAIRFEEALHAYFNVGNVRQARVKGLDAVHFLDKTDHYREKVQRGDVEITSETDRVYLDTQTPVELSDHAMDRRIEVTKRNSLTTVIWNPWSVKANAMSDLGPNEWTRMLCLETSNVLDYAVDLGGGGIHRMGAVVSVA